MKLTPRAITVSPSGPFGCDFNYVLPLFVGKEAKGHVLVRNKTHLYEVILAYCFVALEGIDCHNQASADFHQTRDRCQI